MEQSQIPTEIYRYSIKNIPIDKIKDFCPDPKAMKPVDFFMMINVRITAIDKGIAFAKDQEERIYWVSEFVNWVCLKNNFMKRLVQILVENELILTRLWREPYIDVYSEELILICIQKHFFETGMINVIPPNMDSDGGSGNGYVQ